MKRRVVVTGIGMVTPHGMVADAVFDALLAGRSAVQRWDQDMPAPVLAARTEFDPGRWFTRLQLAGVDRVSQMAVAAAELACDDAGTAPAGATAGVYVGTGMGGAAALDQAYANLHGKRRIHPLTIPAFMPNAPAAHVSMRLQIHGPVLTYSMACASSAVAIAEAARAVARGDLEMALAGGSEAQVVPGAVASWQSLQTLAAADCADPVRACQPFASTRSGLVLGEGAAFLLLEPHAHAVARGARIYAEIAGSGFSSDALHLTKPDAAGQVRALQAALHMAQRDSDVTIGDVGYCNAHGTGTVVGDVVECTALRTVWGDAIDDLAVSSTKALHGHLLGAAGALEAAVTAMALYRQALPPALHCDRQDPACAIRLVQPGATVETILKAAISNSFAFGGANQVLVFKRAET